VLLKAAEAVSRNLKKLSIDYPIIHANNGLEALEILLNKYSEKKLPNLFLLDLNMPRELRDQ
jgi:CheY-like chemotaxis protein